jgi:hypothetical protein
MVTEQVRITPSGGVRDTRTLPSDATQETTQEAREIKVELTATAYPGVRELRWFHENQDTIASYKGLWIAIRGEKVVASEPTFEEVHDRVLEMGLADALIAHVPDDMTEWDHLLA